MLSFGDLELAVQGWADEKGIFDMSDPLAQICKTQEEIDELIEEIVNDDSQADLELELGDVLVTLCIQAAFQGTNLTHCLEQAYLKISQRKGSMQNGHFVKDAY